MIKERLAAMSFRLVGERSGKSVLMSRYGRQPMSANNML